MTAGDVITIRENAYGEKANYYDGTDDYMLADAHAVARVAANDTVGTYTAWIYLDNIDGTNCIFSAGDNNSVDQALAIFNTTAGMLAKLTVGGVKQWEITETSASIKARTWTHIAIVQTGTRPIFYINGEAVAMTDAVSTDLTAWYDELTAVDKFAIAVQETNATHLNNYKGAIGEIKYWNLGLTADEILKDKQGAAQSGAAIRVAAIAAALVFDITMESDGTTDSGSGADNGTLIGDAHYGGEVSTWSRAVEANSTGHAAEFINTFRDVDKFVSVIKRGD